MVSTIASLPQLRPEPRQEMVMPRTSSDLVLLFWARAGQHVAMRHKMMKILMARSYLDWHQIGCPFCPSLLPGYKELLS